MCAYICECVCLCMYMLEHVHVRVCVVLPTCAGGRREWRRRPLVSVIPCTGFNERKGQYLPGSQLPSVLQASILWGEMLRWSSCSSWTDFPS